MTPPDSHTLGALLSPMEREGRERERREVEGKGEKGEGGGKGKGGREGRRREGGKGGEGIRHLLLPQAHTAVAAYGHICTADSSRTIIVLYTGQHICPAKELEEETWSSKTDVATYHRE